jgi:hypothetical protein
MTIEFSVTLSGLRKASACINGYNKVVRMLQNKPFSEADSERGSYIRLAHKEPIPLLSILESNGLDDALWALSCATGVDRDARLFSVWCARQVQHLMTDQRSIDALDVAERFANGTATEKELTAAWDAACAAAWDAACAASRAAACAAAWAAARDAACAASRDAACAAAWDAACAASRDAAWAAQKSMFIRMCNGAAPWQK